MLFDFSGFLRFAYLWLCRCAWTPRRALVATAFSLFLPLEIAIHLGLWLDHLLYPGHRRRRVDAPVFITGNPRSGTTFLHRLLAEDTDRFATMCMWEVLFAPSVTQRCALRAAGALERRVGSPCRRLWKRVERRWDASMHRISLAAPEEDDYLLLHAWRALTTGLSAGLLEEARPYTYFDEALAPQDRRRVMTFYRSCIKRHLHAAALRAGDGIARRYLAKNPALCPKLESVFEEFPDATIIYLVRSPLEVLPSYADMMDFSWRAVGVRGGRDALREYLIEMAKHWYRYPLERLARMPAERYVVVKYDDLTADPEGTVRGIYARFGWHVSPGFAGVLRAEAARARRYRSHHDYAPEALGLSRERIVAEFRDVFERFDFPTDTAASGVSKGSAAVGTHDSPGPCIARRPRLQQRLSSSEPRRGRQSRPGRSSRAASGGPHDPGS
jgi:hypothetical protein